MVEDTYIMLKKNIKGKVHQLQRLKVFYAINENNLDLKRKYGWTLE
jgi:hypothetical protein